jgi:hypothetical protein
MIERVGGCGGTRLAGDRARGFDGVGIGRFAMGDGGLAEFLNRLEDGHARLFAQHFAEQHAE